MNIKEISMAFKNVDKEIQKEREQQESHGYFDNVHITDDFTPEAKAEIERKKLLALKKQQELLKKQNEPNYIIQEFMNGSHKSLDTSKNENYNLGQELIEENASSEQTNSELKQELADMMGIDEESLEQIISEMEITEDTQENNEYDNKESDIYNDLNEEDYDDDYVEHNRGSRPETVVKLQSNKLDIEDTDRITAMDEIESKMDSLLHSIESFGNTVVMGDSLSDIKKQMIADMEDNGVETNGTNIFNVESSLEDDYSNEEDEIDYNNDNDDNEYKQQQKEDSLDYENNDYEDDKNTDIDDEDTDIDDEDVIDTSENDNYIDELEDEHDELEDEHDELEDEHDELETQTYNEKKNSHYRKNNNTSANKEGISKNVNIEQHHTKEYYEKYNNESIDSNFETDETKKYNLDDTIDDQEYKDEYYFESDNEQADNEEIYEKYTDEYDGYNEGLDYESYNDIVDEQENYTESTTFDDYSYMDNDEYNSDSFENEYDNFDSYNEYDDDNYGNEDW